MCVFILSTSCSSSSSTWMLLWLNTPRNYMKSYVTANFQCRLWHNGQGSKSYGQIKVKLPNLEWHSYSPAKLSLIIKLRFIPPPSLDYLHLCHNRLCINQDHLSLESHGINMQRFNCMSEGVQTACELPPLSHGSPFQE